MAKKQSNGNPEAVTARYVDVKAVSRYTSLGESTIYEWAGQRGRYHQLSIRTRVLFDLEDIDQD